MQLGLNYGPHIIKTQQPWGLPLFTCGSKLGPWHAISECCFRSVVFNSSQTSMPKLNASKIKSPHESSTKTKWAQMAFKESHLAYETLSMKKMLVVLFCNAILGFRIFPFQVLTRIISKFQPNSNKLNDSSPKTSALETSQHQSKGKKNESEGWWKNPCLAPFCHTSETVWV